MKIKKITWQLRRDFTAIFECEHCGFDEVRQMWQDVRRQLSTSGTKIQRGASDMSDLSCPYCEATIDHDRADLWEYENEDEIECPECEKSFILLVEVTYKYTGRRHECQDGEHEYGEWVRMDIDQKTLDRWSETPIMEEFSKEDPHSYYCRDCNNCDDIDYSENMPLGTELTQDQIRSRYDD